MAQAEVTVESGPKAFQSVPLGIPCAGCRSLFSPARRDQRHCRASCRRLALDRRRRVAGIGGPEDRDGVSRGVFE